MLYSEFVQGTGCKETDYNYKVYKDLEVMYMNSNMSKAEIYEYGKKLVDNSKTEAEIALEKQYKEEIERIKRDIEIHKDFVRHYTAMAELHRLDEDAELVKHDKHMANYHKKEAKACRARIRFLKSLFL